jgi:hypothetical protein
MYRTGALALFTVAALSAAAPSTAQAASFLTVGANGLCGEAGCFAGERRTFTHTFSAAERGGATIDISSLSLFRGLVGDMDHNALKITFELADGAVLSWGQFTLAMLAGEFVTLGGEAINWNTALGDLKVRFDLIVRGEGGGVGGGFGGGRFGGGGFGGGGRGGAVAGDDAAGPSPFTDIVVSQPLIGPSVQEVATPVVALPEPGTWALMILGFGGAGAMLRRRRAYHLRYS